MVKKKTIFGIAILALMLSVAVANVFATRGYVMTYYPGTMDVVTNLPEAETITETDQPYTVSSQIPEREGYLFLGYVLDYEIAYEVNYAVIPDPIYGMPEDVIMPIDPTRYSPGETVAVVDQLTTDETTGLNSETNERRLGTWTFIPWDRTDFQIWEDTTITGEWKFRSKYKYTVHHLDIDTYDQLADDEVYWLDELGEVSSESKKPTTEFYAKYQKSKYNPVTAKVYENKRKDFLLPGAIYSKNKTKFIMTVVLTEDNQHIFFFYQRGGAL